jgi:ribonuclease P protein component
MSLGNPNVTLVDGATTFVFRPTNQLGVYVWENSTPQTPQHFIARSQKAKNGTTRATIERKMEIAPSGTYPEVTARAYVVIEAPDHPGVTSAVLATLVKQLVSPNVGDAAGIQRLLLQEV